VERLTEYLGDDVTMAPIVDVEGVWIDPAHPVKATVENRGVSIARNAVTAASREKQHYALGYRRSRTSGRSSEPGLLQEPRVTKKLFNDNPASWL
jgi:hypothetical protein